MVKNSIKNKFPRQRKCKECKQEFTQYNPLQTKCNECVLKGMYKKKPKCKPLKEHKRRKKDPLYALCDDLWSKAVKVLASNKCEYSGRSDGVLNSHHMFSRSNKSTRWDVNNGVCLLAQYHTLSSKFSAHKTPFLFQEFMIKKRGKKWYENLKLKAHSSGKDIDLEKVKEELSIIVYGKPKKLPWE